MAHTVELEGDSYNVVTNVHELCMKSGEERGQNYVWASQNFFSFFTFSCFRIPPSNSLEGTEGKCITMATWSHMTITWPCSTHPQWQCPCVHHKPRLGFQADGNRRIGQGKSNLISLHAKRKIMCLSLCAGIFWHFQKSFCLTCVSSRHYWKTR